MAHNGILPDAVRPAKRDKRSDTRIAAQDYLSASVLTSLDDRSTRNLIESWMGAGNKLLFLTQNPRYRKHAYLLNERAGIWDNGIWYSNYDYQSPLLAVVRTVFRVQRLPKAAETASATALASRRPRPSLPETDA